MTDMSLEEFARALRELRAALEEKRNPLTTEQRDEVAQLVQWIHENLALVRLHYAPPQALATIDARQVSRGDVWLRPGPHTLRIAATGFEPLEQSFHLNLTNEPLELQVSLTRRAEMPHAANAIRSEESSNAWLWIGIPSAVATLAGAGLFIAGHLVIQEAEQPDRERISQFESEQDRGRVLTGLGIGVAAAGLAGILTAVILKTSVEREEPKQLGLRYDMSPTQLTLWGRF